MKRFLLATGVLVLALTVSVSAFCGETRDTRHGKRYGCNQHPDYGGGGGHRMGPGHGHGMHEGWGMRGPGHMMGHGWRDGPHDWESMKPEEREEWQKMRAKYKMETLELRKQIVTKKMELSTLWDQPEVDEEKVKKLSTELADLQAELEKKQDKYLLQCRKEFGDKGWACPGGRW